MPYIKRGPFGYENTAIFIAFTAIIVQYIGKYTKYCNFSVAWQTQQCTQIANSAGIFVSPTYFQTEEVISGIESSQRIGYVFKFQPNTLSGVTKYKLGSYLFDLHDYSLFGVLQFEIKCNKNSPLNNIFLLQVLCQLMTYDRDLKQLAQQFFFKVYRHLKIIIFPNFFLPSSTSKQ